MASVKTNSRTVRFADSLPGASLSEVQEYEVPHIPETTPRGFVECCDALLESMEAGEPAMKRNALVHVEGRVLTLASSRHGSQVVRRALQIAQRGEEQETLVRELHGHVLELAVTSVGSQVLQWCLQLLPPSSAHFIFAEIDDNARSMAYHDFGHLVLCRIIENMPRVEIEALASTLLGVSNGVSELWQNSNGQRVVKSLLDYGPPSAQECVRRCLFEHSNLEGLSSAPCVTNWF